MFQIGLILWHSTRHPNSKGKSGPPKIQLNQGGVTHNFLRHPSGGRHPATALVYFHFIITSYQRQTSCLETDFATESDKKLHQLSLLQPLPDTMFKILIHAARMMLGSWVWCKKAMRLGWFCCGSIIAPCGGRFWSNCAGNVLSRGLGVRDGATTHLPWRCTSPRVRYKILY